MLPRPGPFVKKLTYKKRIDNYTVICYNLNIIKKGENKMDAMILLQLMTGFTLWAIVEILECLYLD